jgi:hypothetical protein
MKILAAILLAAATGATAAASAATTVTIAPSTLSFKQSMAACPGALAGITITQNHLRVAEQPGVLSDLDAASPTAQLLTLQNATGAAAAVTVNASTHTVTGKNVKLSGKSVACVWPD